jgi:hypothetical protein
MARRKTDKTGASKHRTAPPKTASQLVPALSSDYRLGIIFLLLLEVVVVIALLEAKEPWFTRSPSRGVLAGMIFGSLLLWGVAVGLRLLGRSRPQFGWTVALCVVWLIVLLGRLACVFLLADSTVPVVMTVFVGEVACVMMVLAAANERRKATT